MELFLVLIPVTLGLVVLSLWAFLWSAKNEQFEDLDKQAWSILFEENDTRQPLKNPDVVPEGDKAP
jgi:cbb3-type cytochrome oxidase maturation protein